MKNNFKRTKVASIFCLFLLISFNSSSQERNLDNISVGIQLQQVQNDFGFGMHVLSPTFWQSFRLKSSYNINYLIQTNIDGLSLWTAYSNLNFGTRYQSLLSNEISLYFEAGSQMLINPKSISSEKINFGAYGLFGFEFFLNPNSDYNTSFFIELGAEGNNSRADKVISKPKIANGFITSVGIRF